MTEPYRTPAGWYPQGEVYRYWNGTAWTADTAPITAPTTQPARPTQPVQQAPSAPAPPAPSRPPATQSAPYDAVPAPRYQPPAPPAPPYGYSVPVAVAPKNPGLSLLASFFIPGLGSMINGEVGKGVGILVGYLVSCVLTLVLIGLVGVVAFWIWGMVDAYQGAQRWNARYGILS